MDDAIQTRRLVPDLHRPDSRVIGHSGPPLIELIDPLDEVLARMRRGDYDRPEVLDATVDRLLTVL